VTRTLKIKTKNIANGWQQYTLSNDQGMKVRFLNYGGIITDIIVPDRAGNMENVVLAYKDLGDYENNPNYFGALIGRVSGRIEGASFEIDGTPYTLEENDGDNHLHGGSQGFHQIIWRAKPFETDEHVGVALSHSSADGDSGYPGQLDVTIRYTLSNQNEFTITYEATTTEKTPVSLTNHSYFNLSGDAKRTVGDHEVTMNSEQVIELDEHLIPTGRLLDVKDTTFDFEKGRQLKTGLSDHLDQHVYADNGYDHYFLFNKDETGNIMVKDDTSGRTLSVKTDQPGLVMYTGNMLDETLSLSSGPSSKHLGVCLETQTSSAGLHHQNLPSLMLNPDETYHTETTFTFGTDKDKNQS